MAYFSCHFILMCEQFVKATLILMLVNGNIKVVNRMLLCENILTKKYPNERRGAAFDKYKQIILKRLLLVYERYDRTFLLEFVLIVSFGEYQNTLKD